MIESSDKTDADFTDLTVDIVSAYVANNSVHRGDLPAIIASVHQALKGLAAPKAPEPEKPEPAVSIRRSITPDYLISLEDGKRYKSLKRHLAGRGMTPDEYRAKWGLPADYPMVSPNYAKQRSELAKSIGLGQLRSRAAAPDATPEPEAEAEPEDPAPKKRSPRKKAG
jgi:predicted transcriptional regulator